MEIQIQPRAASGARATVLSSQRFAVEVRQVWDAAWQRVSYLSPISSSHVVAPAYGRASFKLHYGRIKREDVNQFQQYYDIGVLYWYVRILSIGSVGTKQEWVGVIDSDVLMPHGGSLASGELDLEAFEILHELDRDVIRTAKAKDGNDAIIDIDGCPEFNRRYKKGVQVFGNRSTDRAADGQYVFSTDGESWSNLQIVEMILERHTPEDGPTYVLAGQKSVLDGIHEVHDINGLSPLQALNKLIPRGRGIGFVAEVSGNIVTLNVFTALEVAVPYGGITIPANSKRVALDVTSDYEMNEVSITRSVVNRYDKIEARAKENILTCMTTSYRDGNCRERWLDDREVDYILGAAETDTYDDPDTDKATENDRRRTYDDVAEVYCKHGLKSNWNKLSGSGDGSPQLPALLKCDDDGEVAPSQEAPYFPMGKHFERWIPLEEGKDYTTTPPTLKRPADAEPSFLQPFALIEHPDTPGKFLLVNKVGEGFSGLNAHFKVFPRDAAFGIEADPLHVYALNSYDPDSQPPSNVGPVFDYHDLQATVAFRTDVALRVTASSDSASDSVRKRTKVIYVKDAEYWYIVPGTCIGVKPDGSLIKFAGDPVLRNDVTRLREAAAFALAWYGRERASLSLTLKRIDDLAPLGAMITTTITAEASIVIGTVATMIEKNYVGNVFSRLQTDWGELDFSGD